MRTISADKLDLSDYVKPGDLVVWGQACAEPLTLTESLVRQREAIGRFRGFIGATFSKTFSPTHADFIQFVGTCAIGGARKLAQAGVLDIIPLHITACDRMFERGWLKCDVALVQVAPPDANGTYSLGLAGDWIRAAVSHARVVIAEVNSQVPRTSCAEPLTESEIDVCVHTDRPLLEMPSAVPNDIDRAIARHALEYVPDRAVIQVGIGSVPDALVSMLGSHRGLGVHSGMIGDSLVDLIQRGVITNEHKEIDTGLTITGQLLGTRKLYDFCDGNPVVRLMPVRHTHDISVVSSLSKVISLNSAIEVDLSGQVNAEVAGGAYLGAVGGQLDFGRAAIRSVGGRSIIALPSTTTDGRSRIVGSLQGPVTTPRSDVDLIITEYGAAELRSATFHERLAALIRIAHPAHRDALAQQGAVAGARRAT